MKKLFSILILIFSLTACSYQKLEFEKESGNYNRVECRKKFRVSLPEDHKTKYLWSVAHNYDKGMISYWQSVFHGTYVDFNFEAVKPGKTEITFYLYSNKDTLQVRTFLVEIK